MTHVRMPDGTIVDVPDNPTPEQLQALRTIQARAPTKSDSRLGGFFGGVLKPLDNLATLVSKVPLDPSRALAAKMMGGQPGPTIGDATDTFARAVGMPTTAQAVTKNNAYRANNSRTGYQALGNIAGTLPTLALPGGVMAQGAAAGALLTEDPTNLGQLAKDAAIGAAAGKAGEFVGKRVVAPLASRVARTAPAQAIKKVVSNAANDAISAVSSRVPALRAAPRLPAPSSLGTMGRDAQVRAARFARIGVKAPTTGMVTRDPAAWNFERQAAKDAAHGQPLQAAFQNVDQDLANAARGQVDALGGAIGPEATGQRVSEALAAKNKQMQEAIGAAYKEAREAKGDYTVGALDHFKAAMNDPELVDNPTFDAMTAAIGKRLQRYGVVGEDGELRGLTLQQAEETRKFIGGLGSSADATTRMARARLIDGLDESVASGNYGDVFAQPRAMAKARFEEFKNTFPGRVANEGIPPERLGARVLSQTTPLSDLRALKTSLNSGGQAGAQAWQNLRAQAVNDIFSPAISPDGAVNGGALYRNFQKNAPRLRTLLEPDEYKSARSLALAGRDATADVPHSYVNHSNTASTLGNMFNPAQTADPGILIQAAKRQIPRIGGALAGMIPGGPVGAAAGYAGVETAQDLAARRAAQAASSALSDKVGLALDPSAALSYAEELQRRQAEEAARRLFYQAAGGLFGRAVAPPLLTNRFTQ